MSLWFKIKKICLNNYRPTKNKWYGSVSIEHQEPPYRGLVRIRVGSKVYPGKFKVLVKYVKGRINKPFIVPISKCFFSIEPTGNIILTVESITQEDFDRVKKWKRYSKKNVLKRKSRRKSK